MHANKIVNLMKNHHHHHNTAAAATATDAIYIYQWMYMREWYAKRSIIKVPQVPNMLQANNSATIIIPTTKIIYTSNYFGMVFQLSKTTLDALGKNRQQHHLSWVIAYYFHVSQILKPDDKIYTIAYSMCVLVRYIIMHGSASS